MLRCNLRFFANIVPYWVKRVSFDTKEIENVNKNIFALAKEEGEEARRRECQSVARDSRTPCPSLSSC